MSRLILGWLLVAAVVVAAVFVSAPSAVGVGAEMPVIAVSVRNLQVTATADGTLTRSDRATIRFGTTAAVADDEIGSRALPGVGLTGVGSSSQAVDTSAQALAGAQGVVVPAGAAAGAGAPGGTLPGGTLPGGTLPGGTLPGSFPSTGLPSGTLPSGSLPSGTVPSGSLPSGADPSSASSDTTTTVSTAASTSTESTTGWPTTSASVTTWTTTLSTPSTASSTDQPTTEQSTTQQPTTSASVTILTSTVTLTLPPTTLPPTTVLATTTTTATVTATQPTQQLPQTQPIATQARSSTSTAAQSVPTVSTGNQLSAGANAGAQVLTSIATVGTEIVNGSVLYTANGNAVVAVLGGAPQWRALDLDSSDGPDVRDLEQLLVTLGYGSGLTVDSTFDDATADAVEAWEEDLGRADPDGSVELGDLVSVQPGLTVLERAAEPGAVLRTGLPLLRLATAELTVRATVAADRLTPWAVGASTALTWADGSVDSGTIRSVGRDASNSLVTVTIEPSDTRGQRSGSAVTAAVVTHSRSGVLAVPVSAVFAANGKPAVTLASGDLAPITLGLVADGWVEVTGLAAGQLVQLPT